MAALTFSEVATAWRQERCALGEDTTDWNALRAHLIALGWGDPGSPPPGWLDTTGGAYYCQQAPTPSGGVAGETGGGGMFDNIPDELINCAWTKRSDIAGLYASNGWATGTVADKRRALNDWWSWTPEDKRGLAPLAWCQAICGVTATPPPTGSTGGTRSPSTDGIILQPYIDWAKANPIPAAIIGLVVLKILR